jgi:nitrogen regulatory protein P-II 1
MKNLVMIVHAAAQQELADQLRGLHSVRGFTFSHVEGHGGGDTTDSALSARDRVVGYVPRIRVDILLDDADVQGVVSALRAPECGLRGRGIYWVHTVEQSGRF